MDLEQFIATLSEDEKQLHKDLIEECRLRVAGHRECRVWIDEHSAKLPTELESKTQTV